MELDDSDLSILHPSWSPGSVASLFVEDEAMDELSVVYSSTKFVDDADVTEVEEVRVSGIDDRECGIDGEG